MYLGWLDFLTGMALGHTLVQKMGPGKMRAVVFAMDDDRYFVAESGGEDMARKIVTAKVADISVDQIKIYPRAEWKLDADESTIPRVKAGMLLNTRLVRFHLDREVYSPVQRAAPASSPYLKQPKSQAASYVRAGVFGVIKSIYDPTQAKEQGRSIYYAVTVTDFDSGNDLVYGNLASLGFRAVTEAKQDGTFNGVVKSINKESSDCFTVVITDLDTGGDLTYSNLTDVVVEVGQKIGPRGTVGAYVPEVGQRIWPTTILGIHVPRSAAVTEQAGEHHKHPVSEKPQFDKPTWRGSFVGHEIPWNAKVMSKKNLRISRYTGSRTMMRIPVMVKIKLIWDGSQWLTQDEWDAKFGK